MLPACQVGGRDHVDRAARRPRARPGAVIEAPAVRVGAAVDRGLRLIEPLIPRRSSPMKRRELLSGLAAARRQRLRPRGVTTRLLGYASGGRWPTVYSIGAGPVRGNVVMFVQPAASRAEASRAASKSAPPPRMVRKALVA